MHKETFIEFVKYACIGAVNVAIDFGILELLMNITGIYKGYTLFVFNIISFIAYSINGYYMNKRFTFKSSKSSYWKYSSVLASTMLLNGLILSTLSLHNVFNLKPVLWASICKAIASSTTGIINFIVNKFVVFKHDATPH